MKIKKILCIIFSFCIIMSMVGCSSNDGNGYIFRVALYNDPQNLDPQLATDEASLMVLENIFDGLFRLDKQGNIQNAVVKDYTVSDDGKGYVFELRDDVYWTDKVSYENKQKRQLRAQDFVFAFKRLVDPKTYSPYAEKYFCIKNAEKINKGELKLDELGVKAQNDRILVVELEYADTEFLNLLTQTSSMPCNDDFFYSTNGKYGLEEDCVASNGPFYMKRWTYNPYDKDNFVILRKNETYCDADFVTPASLNFFIIRDDSNKTAEEKILSDFKVEKYDCVIDDGSNALLYEGKYNYESYQVGTSGLLINPASQKLSNANMRKAILSATDKSISKISGLRGITPAFSIVPENVTMLNKQYRELAAQPAEGKFNKELAQYLWVSNVSGEEKSNLNNVTVLVSSDYNYADNVNKILEGWQDALGVYVSVEIVADNEYKNRLSEGNYDIAVVQIKGDYNSPQAYLHLFESSSEKNIYKFSNNDYDAYIQSARTSNTLSKSVEYYSQAESNIIDNGYFIPLYFHEKYLAYSKKSWDYIFNPFTNQIDFRNAKCSS